jgi:hypothetical protein
MAAIVYVFILTKSGWQTVANAFIWLAVCHHITEMEEYNIVIKKYLGIVVQLWMEFSSLAFLHDLTSRPGFATDGWV